MRPENVTQKNGCNIQCAATSQVGCQGFKYHVFGISTYLGITAGDIATFPGVRVGADQLGRTWY